MSYTHYWKLFRDLTPQEWEKVAPKVAEIIQYGLDHDLIVKGRVGEEAIDIEADEGGFHFTRAAGMYGSCPTCRQPYDLIVTRVLAHIRNLIPGVLSLSSDGGGDAFQLDLPA